MIVSGFTQRFHDRDLSHTSVQDHEHCFSCVRQICRIQPDNVKSCQHIQCPRGCGHHYHACKEAEHSLLCLEERVACINQGNGCPVILVRKKMPQHIPVCPASVVTCNAEWNRLPLYTVEQGKDTIPTLPEAKTYVDCGQLDVAFALRDQRVLIDTTNAPKRTKFRSQFSLKPPFSQAGHHSTTHSSSASVDRERVNDDYNRHIDSQTSSHGNSMYNHLVDASKEAAHSLTSALDIVSSHMAHEYLGHNEEQSLLQQKTMASSVDALPGEGTSNSDGSRPVDEAFFGDACLSQGTVLDVKNKGQHYQEGTASHNVSLGQVVQNNQRLHHLLCVNINVESITKYQPKPPNMYTFLCNQTFRRDQFVHHFRNVHCEIQAGLHGWIEQRCPLAYLGCPFSFRRFQPSPPGSSICHSWLLESFGLVSNCLRDQPLHQTPEHLISHLTSRKDQSSRVGQSQKNLSIEQVAGSSSSTLKNVDPAFGHVDNYNLHDKLVSIGNVEHGHVGKPESFRSEPSLWNFHVNMETDKSDFLTTKQQNALPADKGKTLSTSSDTYYEARTRDYVQQALKCGDQMVPTTRQTSCDNHYIEEWTSESETSFPHCQHAILERNYPDRKIQHVAGRSTYSYLPSLDSPSLPKSDDNVTQSGCTEIVKRPPLEGNEELFRPVIYTGYSWDSPIKVNYVPLLETEDSAVRLGTGFISLNDLPSEILRHIARFLDSFSLFNLSLVSRLMRDICSSLLDELGIVTLIWEPHTVGQRVSWRVVGKRWTFSTSFHLVRGWQFSGHNPISQHLLTCPYNQDKVINSERFSLTPQTELPMDQQLKEGREQNRKQEKWKGSSSIWFTPVLFGGAEAEDEPQEVAEGSV